jgi:hypothetical protein
MFDDSTSTSAWYDVEQECTEGWMLTLGGVVVVYGLALVSVALGVYAWRHR